MGQDFTRFDRATLDMLAADMSKMLDRYGYPIDVADDAIRPHLPAFLRALGAEVHDEPAAPAPAEEFARHNHDGGKLFFNHLKPVGQCPRCDQLRAGATPREAHPAIRAAASKREDDNRRVQEIRAHFAAGGPHDRGTCGPVCTFGDW